MPGALDRLRDHFRDPWPLARHYERPGYEQTVPKMLRELFQCRNFQPQKLITKSVRLFNKRIDLDEAFDWDKEKVWISSKGGLRVDTWYLQMLDFLQEAANNPRKYGIPQQYRQRIRDAVDVLELLR